MDALVAARLAEDPSAENEAWAQKAREELGLADEALGHHHRGLVKRPGIHLAVGECHLDMAHCLMLRMNPAHWITPLVPGLLTTVEENLPLTDRRRERAQQIGAFVLAGHPITELERDAFVDALEAAYRVRQRSTARVRSFARIVMGLALLMTVMAITVAVCGYFWPTKVPLCFKPANPPKSAHPFTLVCPTASANAAQGPVTQAELEKVVSPADYIVVEITGLVSATIAAAVALRKIRGTSTPYDVPLSLAALKLPTGALTAVFGILLMRGNFIPGLSALDSSEQIIGWAIVLGYAQQVFTGFVDSQAQTVLSSVSSNSTTKVVEAPRLPERTRPGAAPEAAPEVMPEAAPEGGTTGDASSEAGP
ncbi:hypothetical protein ACH4ZX_25815 [Streptomyces sp. NPDC020490]|uniref:hypothetical protein n=1 Tax=Streptomyces sp. NPDC020490 TaxID=3365078 RepID=UPI0037B08A20